MRACTALRDDAMTGTHRSHGHPTGKGAQLKALDGRADGQRDRDLQRLRRRSRHEVSPALQWQEDRVLKNAGSKVALVTGGASGLGKAIAQRLSRDGTAVVIGDIQEHTGRVCAEEIGGAFSPLDVTDEQQWRTVVEWIVQRYGSLHIVINNAGIAGPSDAANPEDARLNDWRKVFAVNVESVFLGCRATMRTIHESGGGAIVNIASVAATLASPYAAAYGASKAAVRQLTKSVAQYCVEKKWNVRCNSVHPGIVRTPLWDAQAQDKARMLGLPFHEYVKQREAIVPSGHFTPSSDVAAAVSFLVSDDACHITGTKLIVDGGITGCDTYHWVRR